MKKSHFYARAMIGPAISLVTMLAFIVFWFWPEKPSDVEHLPIAKSAFIIGSKGEISSNNTTSTPLAANDTFIGIADQLHRLTQVTIFYNTDVPSATDGIQLQFSTNGTDWQRIEKESAAADANHPTGYGGKITFPVFVQYFRLLYINGASPQSTFDIQTIYHHEKNLDFGGSTATSSSEEFMLEVAKGNVPGHSFLIQRGHNPDLDTGSQEDVWEEGGEISYLSSAERMIVTSTTDADTIGGTGAQSILVQGIDDTGVQIGEVFPMHGIAGDTTVLAYKYINAIIVSAAGTSLYNEGIITLTASAAATVQAQLDSIESLHQGSHYTVPTGFTGHLLQVELNAAKVSGGGTPVVEFKGLAITPTGVQLQLFDKKMDAGVQDELDIIVPVYSQFQAGTRIRMAAITDTNNTEVRTRMYILLVAD